MKKLNVLFPLLAFASLSSAANLAVDLPFAPLQHAHSDADQPVAGHLQIISHPHRITIPSYKLPEDDTIRAGCEAKGIHTLTTLHEAMHCIEDIAIGRSGKITIEMLQPPTESYDTLTIAHANGDRIRIVGKCNGPCRINFNSGEDGIVLTDGHQLAQLSNFELIGGGNSAGLSVGNHSSLRFNHVKVSHFSIGIHAYLQSTVLGSNLILLDNASYGIYALKNSNVEIDNALIAMGQPVDIKLDIASSFSCQNQCTYLTKDIKRYSTFDVAFAP